MVIYWLIVVPCFCRLVVVVVESSSFSPFVVKLRHFRSLQLNSNHGQLLVAFLYGGERTCDMMTTSDDG